MPSIIPIAIVVAIGAALLGSMAFQYQESVHKVILSPLEEKCMEIANEGYQIHALYPNANPEDLPEIEMNRMLHLDEKWMTECVAMLPAESIFNIANNVKRDSSLGE